MCLQCVEVSQESPAWTTFLTHTDGVVCRGLKDMVLTAIGTLVARAQSYEQVGVATSKWVGLKVGVWVGLGSLRTCSYHLGRKRKERGGVL